MFLRDHGPFPGLPFEGAVVHRLARLSDRFSSSKALHFGGKPCLELLPGHDLRTFMGVVSSQHILGRDGSPWPARRVRDRLPTLGRFKGAVGSGSSYRGRLSII